MEQIHNQLLRAMSERGPGCHRKWHWLEIGHMILHSLYILVYSLQSDVQIILSCDLMYYLHLTSRTTELNTFTEVEKHTVGQCK